MELQKRDFTEHMSFEFLELLRKQNSAWRLLASQQAPMAAAFLYKEFIAGNRRMIGEQELIGRLDNFIERINQGRDERIFPRTAKEYLDEWADDEHGWLRKFYPAGHDEPYFDITSLAQKAIEWLLSLRQQTFIGTESRLITVFDLLHQIAERSESDPELRLAELERRKAELEQEISRVKTGKVELLDDTQVKERFWQAMTIAREIMSDFRAVEQNFRDLDRSMREKIAIWNKGKGELLATIFNEQDGINQSEQGKSFSAFWNYLMSSGSQEDFQTTIDKVLALQAVKELAAEQNVRHINADWVNAGAHVQETVAVLSEQLRRYVDENFLEEERRISQIIQEIEGKAVAVRNNIPKTWELVIDSVAPELSLPLDRPLFTPPQRPEIRDDVITAGDENISTEELFTQVYVDKGKLKDRIDFLLQAQGNISLSEIIEHYPLELGLSELITYMVIAGDKEQASFKADKQAEVKWQDENGKQKIARFDEIIFQRV
ncbi:MAG: DUF3375 domain-containing protein [Negativicutes bacterium]|nr:DUF3375 domain-containing protein [Negativicutes bacterium]